MKSKDTATLINLNIEKVVTRGLSKNPKSLPSWLLYDDLGDEIFREIMQMPEYYPTRCEADIFSTQHSQILKDIMGDAPSFNLIELGAGDGTKTELLLHSFFKKGIKFKYFPLDISPHVLDLLKSRLSRRIPGLEIHPIAMDFNRALDSPDTFPEGHQKVFLFLGSNIGNMTQTKSVNFLKKIGGQMNRSDRLLVGFDLHKDPRIIQSAYDDEGGITAHFNFNLLHRLNRELGADFDLKKFSHFPQYDPLEGVAKSFLVSRENQEVFFEKFNRSFYFEQWELLQTEISRKYRHEDIEKLAELAGFEVRTWYEDEKRYYRDVLLQIK
nr:L-histidine N(alpha)-methyltransferase [Saprospiraceae bacterium]